MVTVVVAAALCAFGLYVWRIGASSWFLDEASTASIAGAGFHSFVHQMHFVEQNPPGYFVLLNLWSHVSGTTAETWLRLPSALAAALVVAAIGRLAFVIAGEPAAIIAVLLAVVSPFSLQYGQQARPYALLMLLTACAAVAALEAVTRRSRGWLAAAAVCAVGALWVHYFALLVIAPLMVWLWRQSGLSHRERVAACAVVTTGWVLSLPLAYLQFEQKPSGGVGSYGDLSLGHILWVVGAPFDGRYDTAGPGLVQALGAALIVAAIALLVRSPVDAEATKLLLALVVVPTVALLLLALAGREVMISRYAAAACPFSIVVLAAAVTRRRRLASYGLLIGAVSVAAVALVLSELPDAMYPPTRQVVAAIADKWRPGDAIDDRTGNFAIQYVLQYYAARILPRGVRIYPGLVPAPRSGLWLVDAGRTEVTLAGYKVAQRRNFSTDFDLSLELLVPRSLSTPQH